MSQIRILLIGLGKMGRNHLRVLNEDARFRVAMILDSGATPDWREKYPDAKIITKISEIEAGEIDAIVVAAPTEAHYPLGKALIPMGKPILMEKPLASTPEQCSELLELSEKTGTPVFVGHLERFNPAVRKVKEVIRSGWLGKPIHFSITRVGGYPENVNTGNNVLLDLAIHDIDVLHYLVGPIEPRASLGHSTWKAGILDTAEILVSTPKNEVSASLHVNWITPTKIRTLRVTGTQGVCFADYILQTCTLMGGNLLKRAPTADFDYQSLIEDYKNADRIDFGVKKEEPLKVQLGELHKAIRGQASEICTAKEAAQAVRVADGAIKIL